VIESNVSQYAKPTNAGHSLEDHQQRRVENATGDSIRNLERLRALDF